MAARAAASDRAPTAMAAVVQLEESGRGRVVSFAADPVFRGVWRGSETVFLNAVLLGPSLGPKDK